MLTSSSDLHLHQHCKSWFPSKPSNCTELHGTFLIRTGLNMSSILKYGHEMYLSQDIHLYYFILRNIVYQGLRLSLNTCSTLIYKHFRDTCISRPSFTNSFSSASLFLEQEDPVSLIIRVPICLQRSISKHQCPTCSCFL